MDFCISHFNKKLSELTITDVENYFQKERLETDQLEFKSINSKGSLDEKFNGIQRSVCAFLNSSGGLIIWGAPEGQKINGKKEKIFQGNLTFFTTQIEKDYIVSKISDSIIPLPNGIRVNVLENSTTSMIVIEVESSEYSPHQTMNTYYMRIDGQSKPAPHHYIEALFKKIKYPNIEVFINITNIDVTPTDFKIMFNLFFYNWSPLQNEEKLSFRVIVSNGVFVGWQNPNMWNIFKMSGHEFFKENAKDIFSFGEPVLETKEISFNKSELRGMQNKAKLLISFGGRFSPRKTSEISFDFTNISVSNPNSIISDRNENKLTKDIQDEKGVDREKIIKSFMSLS